nr:serine protease inhibitor 3/4-like [Vanessa tameamea]
MELLKTIFSETYWMQLNGCEAILANSNQSIVVSPLLVRFSLCKVASVASGYSRTELMTVLGINSTKMLQDCYQSLKDVIDPLKNIDVLLLNKIIVNYTDDINPNFITNSTDYGVKVDKVSFNYPKMAVSFINRWVEKASYKRITGILDQTDLDNKTSIILISLAYFKVTWEFPFDIRLTKNKKFHHRDGNVSYVPMMLNSGLYLYLNDEVNNIQPRFKIKCRIEWNKLLQKIGVTRVFNESDSGLNNVLKKDSKLKNVTLSKVKQSTFIDIDEMGIFRQTPVKGTLKIK